ncbi:MAG: TAXI family TRAP transporter solute-binding subunit [Geminicoccaceae bacterium]
MVKSSVMAAGLLVSICLAGNAGAGERDAHREMVNQGTVGVLGGSLTGTYSRLVSDMANLFDNGYELRVLPIIGKGSIKGVEDLLFHRGIDVALLQSDVLDFLVSKNVYPDLDDMLRYITVLYNEEVHLVAGNKISTIQDLEGKKVSFGPSTSGTFMTSSILFRRLGVEVEALDYSNQEGLERLRQGDIDAMVRVAGAPTRLFEDITENDGLHIVPLPLIDGAYLKATITHEQYPGLVQLGVPVQTLAVGAVMAAYNWPVQHPRRNKIQGLVDQLKNRLPELQKPPFHKKWQQVELKKKLPGWIRWQSTASPRS